jgi:hypothetical protein
MKLTSLFPKNSFLTWILSFSSLALLLGILSLAVHVRLGLGHWPEPMVEGYDTTAFKLHQWLVFAIGHFAIFLAIPLWPLLLLFKRFRAGVKTHLVQSIVYSVGWLLIYLFLEYDPTSFSEWWLRR